jgi:hypothetical protein
MMVATKTVELDAGALGIAFGKGVASRPQVLDTHPSSSLVGKLFVGDIVLALETSGATYENMTIAYFLKVLEATNDDPFRKLTVVESKIVKESVHLTNQNEASSKVFDKMIPNIMKGKATGYGHLVEENSDEENSDDLQQAKKDIAELVKQVAAISSKAQKFEVLTRSEYQRYYKKFSTVWSVTSTLSEIFFPPSEAVLGPLNTLKAFVDFIAKLKAYYELYKEGQIFPLKSNLKPFLQDAANGLAIVYTAFPDMYQILKMLQEELQSMFDIY